MEIEKILSGKRKRSLFDAQSNEFSSSTTEEKLITLASLNFWNLLDQTINDYQNYYSEPKDKYILDQLKLTLQSFIGNLQFGKTLISKDTKSLNLKKTVQELKKELAEKIAIKYSLRKLIESYLSGNKETFESENRFFRIDFQKDLTDKLKERDIKESKTFQESYTHLYRFLNQLLIPDFKNNDFKGYLVDNGWDYQSEYIVRFYLEKPNKENYLNAIEYAVNILFLNKEPYHKFFLFRVNFSENDIIQDFYDKNQVGVRFDTKADIEDWNKLNDGKQPKQQYIQRWKQLNDAIQQNDVIIIASFRKLGSKIGKITKGTIFDKIGNKKEFYTILRLEDIKEIDVDKFPFIQTLLPANVTISSIKRNNYTLRKKIYPKVVVKIQTNEFDDIALEVIVNEWLRTEYAPKEYRLQYQLLRTGGNKKDIDIYGRTIENGNLIVQVSNTDNPRTIENKINKLKKYKDFKQLFFFNSPDKKTEEYEIIELNKVISDLRSDAKYNGLISELE